MMQQNHSSVYPLNPIVSSNPQLVEAYNTHPDSMMLMSECFTPEQLRTLINDKATFNKLVLVDREGADCLPLMGDMTNWDNELMPLVEQVALSSDIDELVTQIHNVISVRADYAGMG